MFSKILSSVIKSDSSGSTEVPVDAKSTGKQIALVAKDSISPRGRLQASRGSKTSETAETTEEKAPACETAFSTLEKQSTSEVKCPDKQNSKWPIFNDEFEIIENLGSGNTAKVYLGRSVMDPSQLVAIKMMKNEYLKRSSKIIKNIEQEIQILGSMNHQNIVKMYDYGTDGEIVKPSGKVIKDIVYITMEYISGGLMFNLC